jgi:hypothetical protein
MRRTILSDPGAGRAGYRYGLRPHCKDGPHFKPRFTVRSSIVRSSILPLQRRFLACAIVLAPLAVLISTSHTFAAGDRLTEQFEKEVRPILEESCFNCHGPDKPG